MITKEQIEAHRVAFENGVRDYPNEGYSHELLAICVLALQAIEMQPKITDTIGYIAKLMAASTNDWNAANPDDGSLHGIPVKQWRGAYREGCYDMASGIVQRMGLDSDAVANQYKTEFMALSSLPKVAP